MAGLIGLAARRRDTVFILHRAFTPKRSSSWMVLSTSLRFSTGG